MGFIGQHGFRAVLEEREKLEENAGVPAIASQRLHTPAGSALNRLRARKGGFLHSTEEQTTHRGLGLRCNSIFADIKSVFQIGFLQLGC